MPFFLGNSSSFLETSGLPWLAGSGMILLILWTAIWKGLALWHAAKRNDKYWFIALLVINTVGILEICYLLFVVKLFASSKPPKTKHSGKK